MHTMHPTLLVGPADWDPAHLPREEFAARLAAFWKRMAGSTVAGLAIFGTPRNHAELAYLTNFTPKLEPAIALIPRDGEPRLFVGGGANMLSAAKPLTWVETLLPLREAGPTIAEWSPGIGALALVNGDAMPFGLHESIIARVRSRLDVTGPLGEMMRRKSAREMVLIREACATLDAAFAAMRTAQHERKSATDVVLAGERAAWARGAQDVRSLFGCPLAPFVTPHVAAADPLHVYLAVRHGGYWAEGFDPLWQSVQPRVTGERAILEWAIAAMRPGAPYPKRAEVHSIGLALQEEEWCGVSLVRCAAGEVYTVRVGLGEGGPPAVSAMVTITKQGNEVLWRSATE
jgi:hypothetical protein